MINTNDLIGLKFEEVANLISGNDWGTSNKKFDSIKGCTVKTAKYFASIDEYELIAVERGARNAIYFRIKKASAKVSEKIGAAYVVTI